MWSHGSKYYEFSVLFCGAIAFNQSKVENWIKMSLLLLKLKQKYKFRLKGDILYYWLNKWIMTRIFCTEIVCCSVLYQPLKFQWSILNHPVYTVYILPVILLFWLQFCFPYPFNICIYTVDSFFHMHNFLIFTVFIM